MPHAVRSTPLALALLAACSPSRFEPAPARPTAMIAPDDNRQLDLLFVIDDAGSMGGPQANLVAHFPAFVSALQAGSLPNLHVGVISADLGAGEAGAVFAGCRRGGDGGFLSARPRTKVDGQLCAAPSGHFISDVAAADGQRGKNYVSDLADSLACIAALGTAGCSFPSPLEAMKRALGNQDVNASFLRPHAYLAVVFVSGHDDCSTRSPEALFRSSENEAGQWARCAAGAEPIDGYVDFLRSLKPDGLGHILVAGLVDGATAACHTGDGEAQPATRLGAFVQAFGPRGVLASICHDDFSPALRAIATQIAGMVSSSCVVGSLVRADPLHGSEVADATLRVACTVDEIHSPDTIFERSTALLACDSGVVDPDAPCWLARHDVSCDPLLSPDQVRLEISRPVPSDTSFTDDVRCEAMPPTDLAGHGVVIP